MLATNNPRWFDYLARPLFAAGIIRPAFDQRGNKKVTTDAKQIALVWAVFVALVSGGAWAVNLMLAPPQTRIQYLERAMERIETKVDRIESRLDRVFQNRVDAGHGSP